MKLRLARSILGGLRPVLGVAELLRESSLDLSELLYLLMRRLQTPDGLSGLVLRGLGAGLGRPDPVPGQLGVFLCGLDQLGGFPELVLRGLRSKLGLLGPLHRIPRAELSLLGLFVLSSQEPLGGSLQLPGGVGNCGSGGHGGSVRLTSGLDISHVAHRLLAYRSELGADGAS